MIKKFKKEQLTKISTPQEETQIFPGKIERIKGGIFGKDLDEIVIDDSKIYKPTTKVSIKIAPLDLENEENKKKGKGFYEDTKTDSSIFKEKTGTGGGEEIIRTKEEWDKLLKETIIRADKKNENKKNQIEQKLTKILYQKMIQKKPVVDWKKELRKIFDKEQQEEEIQVTLPPDKKARAAGYYEQGTKFVDYNKKNNLREIVVACDTSGSISKGQTFAFLTEVERLRREFEYDTLWIIYCSDTIDGIDRLTSNPPKKINIAKYDTTGGNGQGFYPPFKLVRDSQKGLFKYEGKPYKIKPSLFIYMTDGYAQYPQKKELKELGISKYEKKVKWFFVTLDSYLNLPPFGSWVHVSLQSIKEAI